ncbi:fatty acid desaturase [Mangrovibacterium diazotrophicum]|uniref:Beta-carotene ketolase (CrtW type) n=1 Tax=Mangrovibacterium diazotrophicum TaxID=1261403 RepID=A0A419W8K7_9BACT|nr:fatty acid desaturase [Mangrovibacterium diazotrophicum]RKD91807.1 beta-carotene ketolase (CrtW type) [Mangrovibacterium diazotrophicum]
MGVFIAILILLCWLGHLVWSLLYAPVDIHSLWMYFHLLLQAYLYTGLFITGHDAMHGLVSPDRKLNDFFGWVASVFFAGLSYKKLRANHYLHHRFPATEKDPDYYTRSQNVLVWWFVFLKRYATIWQFLFMAIVFNVLKIWVEVPRLIVFWIVPAVLASFQLFFVGTYLPHRRPHSDEMRPHQARSQRGPHWWAMLSCYFFGYHWEHHEIPRIPWWQLYREKDKSLQKQKEV